MIRFFLNNKHRINVAKLYLTFSMIIFGTIGILVNYIPLDSLSIACSRSIIGTVFILTVIMCKNKKINISSIKSNVHLLILSGIAIGLNWVFLFEAYKHTTVAIATVCYYTAPMIVVLLSPFILKEKLDYHNIICIIITIAGLVMITGSLKETGEIKGILFGLLAAFSYAAIVLTTKSLKNISPVETTLFQLGVASVVMSVYLLLTDNVSVMSHISIQTISLLIVLGLLHTGVAYLLFFSAMENLPAQTCAIYSYIDPLTAIILSAIILGQSMGWLQICGAGLIFISTICNQFRKISL